jgi:hypothetical protein
VNVCFLLKEHYASGTNTFAFFRKGKHKNNIANIMALKRVGFLTPDGSSLVFSYCYEDAKCTKVIFLLSFKILIQIKCTDCQEATRGKDFQLLFKYVVFGNI